MGSCHLLLEFLDPLYILGAVEPINFQSGMQTDHKQYSPKMLLRTTILIHRLMLFTDIPITIDNGIKISLANLAIVKSK